MLEDEHQHDEGQIKGPEVPKEPTRGRQEMKPFQGQEFSVGQKRFVDRPSSSAFSQNFEHDHDRG